MSRNLPRSLMVSTLLLVAVGVSWLVVTNNARSKSVASVQSGQSETSQALPGVIAGVQSAMDVDATIRAAARATGVAEATLAPSVTSPYVSTYSPAEYPSSITTSAQAEAIVNGMMHNITPIQIVTRMIKRSTISTLTDQTGEQIVTGANGEDPNAPVWIVAIEAPGLSLQSLGLEGTGDANQDAISGFYLGFDAGAGTEEVRGIIPSGALDFEDFVALVTESLPIVSPSPLSSTLEIGVGPTP